MPIPCRLERLPVTFLAPLDRRLAPERCFFLQPVFMILVDVFASNVTVLVSGKAAGGAGCCKQCEHEERGNCGRCFQDHGYFPNWLRLARGHCAHRALSARDNSLVATGAS